MGVLRWGDDHCLICVWCWVANGYVAERRGDQGGGRGDTGFAYFYFLLSGGYRHDRHC